MDWTKIIDVVKNVLMMLAPQFKSPDSVVGVEEVKEALVGINELGLLMVLRFKDGLDFGDFGAILDKWKNDPEFKAKMEAAYTGYDKIPAEFKDIDAGEGIELAAEQVGYLPKLIEAFKKEEAQPAPAPEPAE